jgi:type IV pilus assembly protein PilE
MQQRQTGFTLIEIMIGVIIIGILSAIALPSYTAYVTRARLAEAHTALAGAQPLLEQYWSNQRTYVGFDRVPAESENFSYALSDPDTGSYTLVATGQGNAAGFVFTLDQAGNRATTAAPDGWATNDECWIDRKEGTCSH